MRKNLKQFLFEVRDFMTFVAVMMFIIVATLGKVIFGKLPRIITR